MATVGIFRVASRTFLATALLVTTAAGIAHSQLVDVETASGRPGDTVDITVGFIGQGTGVSALKVDLGFDPRAPITARGNRPACNVNPEIMKESSTFVWLPHGCVPGNDCTGIRAAIISFSPDNNAVPIPSGAIFSCALAIPNEAVVDDRFVIGVESVSAVFPDGSEIDVTAASEGGAVRVVEALSCPGDLDGSGEVTLGEVQETFNAYLNGCPR